MSTGRATRWLAVKAAGTSLTYAPQIDPSPLTVSLSATEPTLASLVIVVTNATGADVTVDSIDFKINIGGNATDFTFTTAGIQTSVSDPVNWAVTSPTVTTSDVATYSLGPSAGPSVTLPNDASVVLRLYDISANLVPGTSTISIVETLSNSTSDGSFEITTFPYGFYFNDLIANVGLGSKLTPAAQVSLNDTVTLTWNSSVIEPSSYTILYSSAGGGQQSATPKLADQWTSPALTSDTMFVLIVSTSVLCGPPLLASMATSVSVRNPALISNSLETGLVTATGTITGVGICPPGTVMMYSGDVAANFDSSGTGIPGTPTEGWQICNGAKNSPDLRDRFIPAAGGQYNVGDKGGQDSYSMTIDQMPTHDHGALTGNSAPGLNYGGVKYCSKGTTTGIMVNVQTDDPNGNRPNALPTVGLNDIQVNPHDHSINAQGSGLPVDNRPQFYALAYLFRMS